MPAHSRPDDNWLIDRHLAKCEGWEYCSKMGFKLSLEWFQTESGKGLGNCTGGRFSSKVVLLLS